MRHSAPNLKDSKNPRLFTFNLAILTGGEIVSRLIYAVAFIYLARVLQPGLYGELELTLALMILLTVVTDMGLKVLGTREVARHNENTESLVRRIVSMQLIVAVLVNVLLVLLVLVLPLNRSLSFLLVGFGISLLGYPLILNWVFQGRDQMIWVAVPQVVRQASFAVLAIWLVNQPSNIFRLPIIEIIAVGLAVLINIGIYNFSGERIRIDVRRGWDKFLYKETLPIGGSQIIWAMRMYLPTLLLGLIAGQAAVGFFAASHRIIMVILALLAVYFVNLFPTMSQASFNSNDQLADLLNRSLRLVVWPSIIFGIVVTIFAPLITRTIYGEVYERGETMMVLMVLIWMVPIMVWRGHARNALIALNYQREELYCSITGVILLVILLVVLSSLTGALGASLAMVISEGIATLITWWRLKVHVPSMSVRRSLVQLPSLEILVNR